MRPWDCWESATACTVSLRWAAFAGYTESGLPLLEQVREGVWALDGNLAPARVLHGPEWRTTTTGGRG